MDFDFNLPGLGRPESSRPKRVAEAIKNELSVLLLQKVGDRRLAQVSISSVEVAPDLKYAKVYFTLPPGTDVSPVRKGMERAKGFFRSHIAKALNLRHTPQLTFHYDSRNEAIERLDTLFREIDQKRKSDDSVE